jgi:glycosyltransferase involved in cell wall biosynthesis
MKKNKRFFITVVIPLYNGGTTIVRALESLLEQTKKFDELIIINDASSDDSREKANNYLTGKVKYKLIDNEKNSGLAKSYNKAIHISQGDLVVTMHQDVILMPDSLEKITGPLENDDIAATSHRVIFPLEVWKEYNFWQKYFFARFVGKETSGLNGQFDCFRKKSLEKVGLFDFEKFRSAGEDADMVYKLSKIGKIVPTNAQIIHLQDLSPRFGPRDIVYKQKQHSEARGALLALGRINGLVPVIKTFFREIMVIALFIPFVNIISLFFIVSYSFFYSKIVFFDEYKNPRIFLLPFFNIYLLFVGFFYSLKGFVYGKQRI